jgi:hypothetical protein
MYFFINQISGQLPDFALSHVKKVTEYGFKYFTAFYSALLKSFHSDHVILFHPPDDPDGRTFFKSIIFNFFVKVRLAGYLKLAGHFPKDGVGKA